MIKSTNYDFEDEWRIVAGGKANGRYSFRPAALSGVILGADASVETKRVMAEILDERFRVTGLKPHTYQAEFSDKRIRIHRLGSS